jgi:hypothetical protein
MHSYRAFLSHQSGLASTGEEVETTGDSGMYTAVFDSSVDELE